MRIILTIIRKEFLQIFRNRLMLPIIFIVPVVQLIIFVSAANMEMKEIAFCVVDKDLSGISQRITSGFRGSSFYRFRGNIFNIEQAEDMLYRDQVDLIIHINKGFEESLLKEQKASSQLLINAIDATKAGLIKAYSETILANINRNIISEWYPGRKTGGGIKSIDISYSFWYNPGLDYKIYMLPGILVILVSIIGIFLTALNLVRERELGTAEQINVTPVKKYQFISGKLIPFWIIALFELAFGLIVGRLIFNLPILGSLPLLFLFAAMYLLVALGIGLFISTLSHNQQQVMFLNFFFMLSFILMSGIFTPVESMPDWAQRINIINPFAYFMKAIRMILLKGSGFRDIQIEFYSLAIYAAIILSLAVWRYRKIT